MIQCKDDFYVLGELDISLEESIAVKVFHQGLYFVLIVVYNPPRSNKMEFIERPDEVLESIQSLMPVKIIGDMKIETLKINNASSKYLSAIESNGFEIIHGQITRVGNVSNTCLDHAIAKSVNHLVLDILTEQNLTDHYPVLLTLNHDDFRKTNGAISRARDLSYLNDKYRILELQSIVAKKFQTIPSDFNTFHKTFIELIDKFDPYKEFKSNQCSKPKYVNNYLKNLISKRNYIHRKWKRRSSDLKNFKGARLKVEKALKKLKRNYYSKRFERCINHPKPTYKLLNDLQGKSDRKQIKIEQIKY